MLVYHTLIFQTFFKVFFPFTYLIIRLLVLTVYFLLLRLKFWIWNFYLKLIFDYWHNVREGTYLIYILVNFIALLLFLFKILIYTYILKWIWSFFCKIYWPFLLINWGFLFILVFKQVFVRFLIIIWNLQLFLLICQKRLFFFNLFWI